MSYAWIRGEEIVAGIVTLLEELHKLVKGPHHSIVYWENQLHKVSWSWQDLMYSDLCAGPASHPLCQGGFHHFRFVCSHVARCTCVMLQHGNKFRINLSKTSLKCFMHLEIYHTMQSKSDKVSSSFVHHLQYPPFCTRMQFFEFILKASFKSLVPTKYLTHIDALQSK